MSDLMEVDLGTEERLLNARQRIMREIEKEIARADVTAAELLAIMAHATGSVLAHQNSREMSPKLGMDLILENMKRGNAETVATLLAKGGVPRAREN